MQQKKILILGASVLQIPGIVRSKELGYHVIAVDGNSQALGFKFADEAIVLSTLDTKQIIKIAEEKEIDGIMTLATDLPIRAVALIAKRLGLVGVSSDTAFRATDKYKMRECLSSKLIPGPEFYMVDNEKDYNDIAKHFNYKFVVKPVDSSGSRGVCFVNSKIESPNAFKYSMPFSRVGEVIIEEYMEGREISVESLSYGDITNICAITDKITTGPPFFVETGHSQPAILTNYEEEQIHMITQNAIDAIGIQNGPSHTEIIITSTGPKIVEIGARLGGDFITSDLVPLSSGYDMVSNSIKIAMGESPDIVDRIMKASAIRYMYTKKGIIESFSGVEAAKSVEGVEKISFSKEIGDTVDVLRSSNDRIGYVISSGDTVFEAVRSCEKAIGMVRISIT